MTNYTNEDLAGALAASADTLDRNPWYTFGGMVEDGRIPDDLTGFMREAATRLRSMTALDGIEVAPARATDPATSKAAARNISATNARGKIALAFYKNFALYGDDGLTAAEATRMAKLEHLAAPWKRVSELKQASIIRPTGDTRRGTRGQAQEVLVLTDHGKVECERLMPVEVMEITAPKAYGVDA